jgi:hypothetical protein
MKFTKGELFKRLKDFPDDTPILFNIDSGNTDNWDTDDVELMSDAFLCPGFDGCSHATPEMDYEIVFFAYRKEK